MTVKSQPMIDHWQMNHQVLGLNGICWENTNDIAKSKHDIMRSVDVSVYTMAISFS